MLQRALETLLLGSNSSRTFYTQTLLPVSLSQATDLSSSKQRDSGASAGAAGEKGAAGGSRDGTAAGSSASLSKKRSEDSNNSNNNKPYEYNLVRTDSRSQTLDAFLAPGTAPRSLTSPPPAAAAAAAAAAGAGAGAAAGAKRKSGAGAEPTMEWDPIRQRMRPVKKVGVCGVISCCFIP